MEPRIISPARDRITLRRAIRTRCQVVAEEGFRLLGEETLDLSEEGMLLVSTASAELGERVFVSLCLPSGRSWIDAEGEVTRIVRGRRLGDRSPSLGLRFDRLDAPDRALLKGSLRHRPPPLPLRRERVDYAATIRAIAALG
ncbi:MAG: PilZ domain-containing protein [Myxococcales bacterium]|nr:PilZ domain-containing protein [Myxococcales bacterium]